MDREKVIADLVEHIESTLAICDEFVDGIPLDLLQYTVHLLKEQDAVEPFHKCIGNSHTLIEDSGFLYCPYCGKPIADTEGR